MEHTPKAEQRIVKGKRSLKKMLEIVEPFTPKRVESAKPDTGEWEIARDYGAGSETKRIRHATEP